MASPSGAGVREIKRLEDLEPDPSNANEGTKRGLDLLDTSLEHYGAGRSVLADRQGKLIAGNKTVERAIEQGFGVIVVKSDGRKVVVVQRTDLDMAKDPKARALAIADNRVGEIDLRWNPEVLTALKTAGVEVGQFFFDDEFARLVDMSAFDATPGVKEGGEEERRRPGVHMAEGYLVSANLPAKQHALWLEAVKRIRDDGDGDAMPMADVLAEMARRVLAGVIHGVDLARAPKKAAVKK